ncbi:uncharacterized protein LOC114271546, partial [Camellia sinensis]|uniref:uncharacterized protein LOC114271546 n=1 Tax=Camellia sinensis TaxID=4442 RepID=UPI001036AC8D
MVPNPRCVEDPDQVKQEVVRHFSQLFSENWKIRPKILDPFAVINSVDAVTLEAVFSKEEVWEAVQDCDGNKAPGPDGFNLNCIQRCWPILKGEILSMVNEFHQNGKPSRGVNSSFIVPIPKKENPIGLGDYRPISLVNSVYKILAKVLSRRLRRVLPSVINEVQSAFVSGRQILDGVLIANEVVDAWKRSKKRGIILKLDFEKAYDSLNWEFLWSMMNNLGFARVSVLVNGSPTEEFQPQKGLRQGDPLSPLLFIIAAESLNLLLARAVEKGLFRGALVGGNGLRISHLQFADDTIVFCEGDQEEVLNIKRVLRCFAVMSGLKINYHKSAVCGVGFQEDEIVGLAQRLNCLSKKLPFNFLGLPLGANPKRKSTWNPILDKWGGSKAGRSVHLVNWGEVTKNKNQGGLGVRDLGEVNDCMLLKWWWRFGAKDKALWKSVVCSRYVRFGGGWVPTLHNTDGASAVWKDIVQLNSLNQSLGVFYNQNLRLSVGNGRRIQFWTDAWLNGRGLNEEFPRLFSPSTEKEESLQQISAKKSLGVWQLQFRRRLLAWEEKELQRLYVVLESAPELRVEAEDSCSWLTSKSGKFSVSSVWSWWVVNKGPGLRVPAGVWASLAPPKMQFLCWLAWRGRVKTSSFLQRIGILPPNAQIQCVFCQSAEESLEHVLLFALWFGGAGQPWLAGGIRIWSSLVLLRVCSNGGLG